METMQTCLVLKLPEDFAYISFVRRVSRDLLTTFGVRAQDIDDIEVMVGELTTNAVRHSHDRFYGIEMTLSDDLAVITVRDQGVGFARQTVLPPGTARADGGGREERFGGWGIPLVESLADQVEFRDNVPHGTIVRAEKRLRRVTENTDAASGTPSA